MTAAHRVRRRFVNSSGGVCINGNNEDAVSKAILQVMGDMTDFNADELNGKLGEAVAQVVGNLGMVGTAETVGDSNVIVPLTIVLGADGVKEHKFTLITYGL